MHVHGPRFEPDAIVLRDSGTLEDTSIPHEKNTQSYKDL